MILYGRVMFSLFKIAALGRSEARESVVGPKGISKVRGAVWAALGSDPDAHMPPIDYRDSFTNLIDSLVPNDVHDDFAGVAYSWLRRILLTGVQVSGGVITWGGGASVNSGEVSKLLEKFAAMQDYIKKYNSDLRKSLPSDLNKVQTIGELAGIVKEIEPYYKKRQYDTRNLKAVESAALKSSEFILGHPGDPLHFDEPVEKIDGTWAEQEEDLVDGMIEDGEWSIVRPHSMESAIYWGHGSDWCTSRHDSRHNFYPAYTGGEVNEPLFIFKNKRTGHRYQFWYNTNMLEDEKGNAVPGQFMDAKDRLIVNMRLLHGLDELLRTHADKEDIRSLDESDLKQKTFKNIPKPGINYHDNDRDEYGLHTSAVWEDAGEPGPTVYGDSRLEWYKQGVLHRDAGPAVIDADGAIEFWNHGVQVCEDNMPSSIVGGTGSGLAVHWARGTSDGVCNAIIQPKEEEYSGAIGSVFELEFLDDKIFLNKYKTIILLSNHQIVVVDKELHKHNLENPGGPVTADPIDKNATADLADCVSILARYINVARANRGRYDAAMKELDKWVHLAAMRRASKKKRKPQ